MEHMDGERRVPTDAELDQMLFDMLQRWCGPAPDREPDRVRIPARLLPTDAELRARAKALGIPAPPRKGTAEWFRDDMLNLLLNSPCDTQGGEGRVGLWNDLPVPTAPGRAPHS